MSVKHYVQYLPNKTYYRFYVVDARPIAHPYKNRPFHRELIYIDLSLHPDCLEAYNLAMKSSRLINAEEFSKKFPPLGMAFARKLSQFCHIPKA